ncbi:MAG: moaC [Methanomicrobia archaeon]|nr:moaC [Methanomicrobia archaeon]
MDITDKPPVFRRARATGRIRLQEATIEAIRSGRVKKGDVLATARLAAILAIKDTDIGGKDRGGDGGSGRSLGSAAQCLGYGQVPGEG